MVLVTNFGLKMKKKERQHNLAEKKYSAMEYFSYFLIKAKLKLWAYSEVTK